MSTARPSSADAIEALFARFDRAIREVGHISMSGEILDASLASAPRRHKRPADALGGLLDAIRASRPPRRSRRHHEPSFHTGSAHSRHSAKRVCCVCSTPSTATRLAVGSAKSSPYAAAAHGVDRRHLCLLPRSRRRAGRRRSNCEGFANGACSSAPEPRAVSLLRGPASVYRGGGSSHVVRHG